MPVAMGGDLFVVEWPRIEWIKPQCGRQLARIHRNVARSRRQRPGLDPHAAVEQRRVVTADAVDDLRDLKQAEPPRTTGVKQAADVTPRKNDPQERIQAVGVSRRADLVVV